MTNAERNNARNRVLVCGPSRLFKYEFGVQWQLINYSAKHLLSINQVHRE